MSSSSHHTVLVVGVTGSAASLGKLVVDYLLTKKNVIIHILVRKEKRSLVSSWESQGVKVFEGDLMDKQSLAAAVKGVDTVVSTVQGGQDVIIDGQTNLLEAASAAGVKRFYPSDYSFDLRTVPEGANVNYDLRRQFHKILKAKNMRFVTVYNGAFMEVAHGVGFNFLKLCYLDQRKIEVYGDPYTLFDLTTVPDTAKYIVESIFDEDAPTYLCVSGETLTVAKWKQILEEVTGKPWSFEFKGSPEDLAAEWKNQMQTLGFNAAMEWMPKMYKANLYLGQGKTYSQHAERYPAVKPTPVKEFVKSIVQ